MLTRKVAIESKESVPVHHTLAKVPIQHCSKALVVITSLFFMWGFLTCLNDILVPHLKSIFDLSYARVMLVQFAFFSAYFLFSVPWSRVVNTAGYQTTMVAGLAIMGIGAFLFIPAAFSASYLLFLLALVTLATGITGLQVAANPYVVALGKPETASSRLNLTQAFNSLGTTIAPYVGGLLILGAAPLTMEALSQFSAEDLHAYRVHQAASVVTPYALIGATLLLLAVAIGTSKLPKIESAVYDAEAKLTDSIWQHPNLLYGAIGIFVYVGAEVSIGSFLVNYLEEPEVGGISAKTAAGFVSSYWSGAMIGRFIGAVILRRLRPGCLLAICAISAATLVIASMLASGSTAMWTILSVGLFNSIMFPTIFSLGVAELGPLTVSGSGMLNMAIGGGAVLPVAQGVIADHIGLHQSFVLPVVCYAFIVFYGLSGSKPNSARQARA